MHILVSLHSVRFGALALQVCAAVCVLCGEASTKLEVALLQDSSKSPRPMKKFLPGNRKKERKPSDDEVQTRKSRTFILL